MTEIREPDDLVVGRAPDVTARPVTLRRDRRRRVLGGVASGLAARLGVDPLWVRVGFGLVALAGGAGAIAYALAWLLLPEVDEVPLRTDVRPTAQRTAGVAAAVLGVLVGLRGSGLWFGDAVVWPLAVVGLGGALIWERSDAAERARLGALAHRMPGRPLEAATGPLAFLRLAAGGAIVLAGLAGLIASGDAEDQVRALLIGGAAVLGGLALALGPWVVRLRSEAEDERRRRIRSEERAEVAAHLHDSVLQTLTLIQRSDAPPEVLRLARAQERELRTWLSGRDAGAVPTRFRGALEATAARVEERLGVPVEVVVVGDADLDDALLALVAAAAEAATNAARHSGAPTVRVFAEIDDDQVELVVRDEGAGSNPAAVPDDRRGLAESVVGRVARHGGRVHVDTAPGEGTEVVLTLPRGGA
jgi:signal transduction histidine kinase